MREYALLKLLHRIAVLNGNTRHYDHLRCRIAQQVAADNPFVIVQYQFAQPVSQFVFGNETSGIRHRQLLYVIAGAGGFQFFFGLPHSGDFRIGIDHTRYAVVVHHILYSQNMVNRRFTLTNRGVRQHGAPRYIAAGVNAGMGCLHMLIHLHAVAQQLDIQFVQSRLIEIRPTLTKTLPASIREALPSFSTVTPSWDTAVTFVFR